MRGDIQKYSEQQGAGTGRQVAGYTQQNDTQFLSPQAKANYTARGALDTDYYNALAALKEKFDSPDSDKIAYAAELVVAAQAPHDEVQQSPNPAFIRADGS